MSYRCSTRGLAAFGLADQADPTISCDLCGVVLVVRTRSGGAPVWFLANRAAPGWALYRSDEPYWRVDLCPKCRPASRPRAVRKK